MADPFDPKTARPGPSRRTAVKAGLGLLLGSPLLQPVRACSKRSPIITARGPPTSSHRVPPGRAAAAGDRHRGRQGRAHPAAIGRRQCRPCCAVDEECGGDGLCRIPEPEYPASDQGRCGQRRRRAAGGPAAAERRRRDHSRAAICSVVPAVAQLTRARNIPVIAFSTDSSVAGRGVYLLSFLPESDVNRIVDYAVSTGKRSFAAMLPENAYGNVVEVAFKQAVARKGARVVAFERYGSDRSNAAKNIAAQLTGADALLLADDGDAVVATADALVTAGANLRNVQLLGTGLWGQSAGVQQRVDAGWFVCRA